MVRLNKVPLQSPPHLGKLPAMQDPRKREWWVEHKSPFPPAPQPPGKKERRPPATGALRGESVWTASHSASFLIIVEGVNKKMFMT